LFPLKDNVPTSRFAIVTVLLIAINVGFFVWQLQAPDNGASNGTFDRLGVSERQQQTLEYGAIPFRLTHPGKECAAGAVVEAGKPQAKIVCEGTDQYREARRLQSQGAPFAPIDAAPWWVTILTSMFMHGGLLHIAGNMLFLWIFGNNVEDALGKMKFLLFYLVAGLVAAYAQSALSPDATVPTIGASGAVAGVLGAYILLHPKAKVLTLIFIIFFVTVIEIPAMILLAVWFALQFLPAVGQLGSVDVADSGGIAYLAHVGGFVFGLIAIKLWLMRRGESDLPPPAQPTLGGPPIGYG
jgi:membrane associated rhomboid family serine protease